MRSEGLAIGEEGKFLKISGTRVFRGLESEGRGNDRFLEFGVKVGKSSPIVAIESTFMSSNDYVIKFQMSRLKCPSETRCCHLKLGQTLNLPAGNKF